MGITGQSQLELLSDVSSVKRASLHGQLRTKSLCLVHYDVRIKPLTFSLPRTPKTQAE